MIAMDILKKVPMFTGLSDKELEKIASLLQTRDFKGNETVVKEGDLAYELYIIKSGSVEVIKGDSGRAVVGGLGGCVDDEIGFQCAQQIFNSRAVADVHLVVRKPGDEIPQALLVPAGVALGTKKDGPLVVVQAMNRKTQSAEMNRHLRADQPVGTRDENCFCIQQMQKT